VASAGGRRGQDVHPANVGSSGRVVKAFAPAEVLCCPPRW
jgi:hypothetical protein